MKPYIKLITLLLIPLVLVIAYGRSDLLLPCADFALQKVRLELPNERAAAQRRAQHIQDSLAAVARADSLVRLADAARHAPDTTRQRVLLFGDSMVEGLAPRLCDYTEHNGDTLVSICWYSSTTVMWAACDTLDYYLRTFRPTLVIATIGGNEQFVRDVPERRSSLQSILDKVGDRPLVWIGTPAWKQDTGINDLIRQTVGRSRYFESTRLTFRRGSDHIHPTFSSSAEWMDSIAPWLESPQRQHPIRMQRPAQQGHRHWRRVILMPDYSPGTKAQ